MADITLPFTQDYPAPLGEDASDQYSSALPRHFIEEFTREGQSVFDPFIGFGTTAFIAEDMGRVPYGVEADGERFEWSAGQLTHWQNIKHGDAAELAGFEFPKMDFCITSPPWMPMNEDWNPLYGGDPAHAGYDIYLARMADIFKAVRGVIKDNAHVIVHVSDLEDENGFTPLVSDMRNVVSRSFTFVSDTTVQWDSDYPETHCLAFKAA